MLTLPTKAELISAIEHNECYQTELTPFENCMLKCDHTLPYGSYKVRGVSHFANKYKPADRVATCSAGNLALATAHTLNRLDATTEAIVPEGISNIKKAKLIAAKAIVTERPFHEVWNLVLDDKLQRSATFVHPLHTAILAGYGSIAKQVASQIPSCALVIPFGIGGLASAIAHAIDTLQLDIELVIAEVQGHSPLLNTLSNKPLVTTKFKSFIEAAGLPCIIPAVATYLQPHVTKIVTVTENEVKAAMRTLYQEKGMVIEGAAGVSLAAARKLTTKKPIVCLLTGKNITPTVFEKIVAA